jgi:hypothetical protein
MALLNGASAQNGRLIYLPQKPRRANDLDTERLAQRE